MRRLLMAAGTWFLCVAPSHAAFEALRAVSVPAAFDPLHPALHYWHMAPARLVDAVPRIHVAGAQPYGLSALRTAAFDITARPGAFGLGLSCATLGRSDYYGELLAVSGLAWQPGRWLALGVILEYGRVDTGPRFAPLHDWALGAGARVRLGRRISLDATASGLSNTATGDTPLFPARLSAGVTLDYSSEVSVRVGTLPGSQWNLGETVRIGEHLALAADLLTSPLRFSLGVLVGTGPVGFDFLYRDHPELGGDFAVGLVIYT